MCSPYNLDRYAEAIAGLIISITLAPLAYEFARHAMRGLFYVPEKVKLIALLAVGLTFWVKHFSQGFLFNFSIHAG